MSEEPPPSRPPEPFAPAAHPPPPRRVPASEPYPPPAPPPDARRRSDAPAAQSNRAKPAPATPRELQQELMGQTLGGRYKIKGVLGEGGMGTVFDAEHLGLGRQVAIKVLSPAQAKKRVAVKRFQQEARAAGAIGHPNICEVYDLGLLDDGSPYLVMEKLVGQTLSERIAKEGGLPFDEVIEIVSQVLSGLNAAHEKGIVHRDIKPENIFLARRSGAPPIIKLLDFGVSKMMAEFQQAGDDALDLTRTGMVMGTPYYMSPEQARGERNLDGRVDVYACGVVMYESIAGKRPFLAPNYNALLLAIINTNPKPLHDIRPATPPVLEAIISRAMARSRADRFPTAKDMLRELAPTSAAFSSQGEERRRPNIEGAAASPPTDGPTRVDTGARSALPQRIRNVPEGASATLRSRMADGVAHRDPPPARQRAMPAPQGRAPQVKPRVPAPAPAPARHRSDPPQLRGAILSSDDSVDIPIDEDGMPIDEDDATAIFNPSTPLRAPPSPGRRRGREPEMTKPIATSAYAGRANAPKPVPPSEPEEWEAETIVRHPNVMQRPQAGKAPAPAPDAGRPFNPEQTMKIDGSELDRLENRRPPPRRR